MAILIHVLGTKRMVVRGSSISLIYPDINLYILPGIFRVLLKFRYLSIKTFAGLIAEGNLEYCWVYTTKGAYAIFAQAYMYVHVFGCRYGARARVRQRCTRKCEATMHVDQKRAHAGCKMKGPSQSVCTPSVGRDMIHLSTSRPEQLPY